MKRDKSEDPEALSYDAVLKARLLIIFNLLFASDRNLNTFVKERKEMTKISIILFIPVEAAKNPEIITGSLLILILTKRTEVPLAWGEG